MLQELLDPSDIVPSSCGNIACRRISKFQFFSTSSNGGAGLAPDKLLDLMDLIADGYVEAGDSGEYYKLTEKGQHLLSEGGGGANES